jgi:glycosyltransferase involved in cell wall biosynthesis
VKKAASIEWLSIMLRQGDPMDKPVRILHIVGVMNRGGIETFLMNIYRKIDRTKVQFDFLVTREESGVFDQEIELLGGQVYKIPYIRKVGFFKFKKNVNSFFNLHKDYKIVHCHMNTWAGLFLPIAKKNKIPIRIAHSHSAQKGSDFLSLNNLRERLFKSIMKININRSTTHSFACGNEAGLWLYGKRQSKKITIIKNGIDTNKLKYEEEIREKVRENLKIPNDTLVLGHVGSMTTPKNHKFIIEIFDTLKKQHANTLLCLVGDGINRESIKDAVQKKGLNSNVMFLGIRNDVHDLLKAFDVFILPSLFEGFPVSAVEAQTAALPCVLSDRISGEVDMGLGLVDFVSLNKPPEYWVEKILEKKNANRNISVNKIIDQGFDSQTTVNDLQQFYYKFGTLGGK